MTISHDRGQVPEAVLYLLGGVVAVVAVIAIWVIPSAAPDEAEHLLAAINVILVATLVATTVYYAIQTRALVEEARATRRIEERRAREERKADLARRTEGAATALVGAANDVVGIGTKISTLIRYRRIWRVGSIDPLFIAVISASKALDQLRYLAPGPASEAGGILFDETLEFFGAAINGANDEKLRGIAERMAKAKTALNGEVAKLVSGAEPAG